MTDTALRGRLLRLADDRAQPAHIRCLATVAANNPTGLPTPANLSDGALAAALWTFAETRAAGPVKELAAAEPEPAPRSSGLVPAACLAAGAVSLVTAAVAWINGGHPPAWLLAVAWVAVALAGLGMVAAVLTGKEMPR